MIENPQNLKEQLLNLTETIATEMKTLKNNKLDLHGKADTAIKADQDSSGNTITTTYVTKVELNNKISAGTSDLQAGSSLLETGFLYFVYE